MRKQVGQLQNTACMEKVQAPQVCSESTSLEKKRMKKIRLANLKGLPSILNSGFKFKGSPGMLYGKANKAEAIVPGIYVYCSMAVIVILRNAVFEVLCHLFNTEFDVTPFYFKL